MINRKITAVVAGVAAAFLWVGCKPGESAPPAAAPPPSAAPTNAGLEQAKVAVDQAWAAAQQTGSNVVEEVKRAGAAAADAGAAKAQELGNQANVEGQKLIESAQRYFTEGRWTNALHQLQQASALNLSESQKQSLASLQKQIEDAMAIAGQATTNATKSATDALNRLFK
jgi:hypothetical protein